MTTPRIVELRTRVLKKNDEVARALRADFAAAGTYVVNVVSAPGAGKTRWLARTLSALRSEFRTAAIVGDLATDNDARRLAESGAPVQQIQTGTICHLEAQMVRDALSAWRLADLDLLLIENVGNLVCPASFDLGEDLRVLLFAVTEGEDKPLKYPTLINSVDLVLLSKIDLALACGFDEPQARANIQRVRPGLRVLSTSAVSGDGCAEWLEAIRAGIRDKRTAPRAAAQ